MSPRTDAARATRQHIGLIGVLFAVVLGIAMRVAGWTWGLPADLHPDEWVIVQGALDLVHRQSFEPATYSRPDHVEIQLSYLAYTFYSHVFLQMPVEGGYARHPDQFLLISRAITTAFGVAMIVLSYLIGKRIHRNVGLIAAVLFALFPPFIENSQYATPDVPLTAALMLVMLGCMHYLSVPGYRSLLVACAATSVAIAIKYPGVLATLTIAVVVIWCGIRDRKYLRIPRDGAIAVVAVIGFLFVISPVLFTNARAVVDSLKDQSGNNHDGVVILGWSGNVEFYAHTYLLMAGVLVTALSLLGLVVVIRERLTQAIPLVLGIVYWLLLSGVALHWPRWGLPMFATPLLLAAIAAHYGYAWVKERRTLGPWLVPIVSALSVVALGNMLVNAAPFATRSIAEDTRLSMQPQLVRLGVTTENAVYEGYSPLLPGAPKKIFDEFKDVGGRIVPVDPAKQYVVESSCMKQRYLSDPIYREFYDTLEDQAPRVAKARAMGTWTHSSFEPLNLVRSPGTLWDYVSGGHPGCDIDVRRLNSS
jgi:hypothetical protein